MIPTTEHPRPDPGRGIYGISVAAELVGTGVQNLRLYERRGLVEPARTPAGTRRYSDNDLARLRRIGELLGAGLNLAGIAAVLDLEADNARLRAELADTYQRAGIPVPDLKPRRGRR
ncbi:MAG: MerR family transcriptional regulator [Streptosporangiales bacterium]|nr:MerR family transcriptional regulator [Streptosporangiales bacterium]